MDTTNNLENLQPRAVWTHFAALCAIPHPSMHERALIEHLIGWAQARAIEASMDAAGNLILRKPASAGCESAPGVILQGHLDMVCQANAGTPHDFERDPIRAVVRDGWVVAEDTTLGADNGIGVALALAVLEEPDLVHPPLEVLLTVNEESGMHGARALASGTLSGKVLINLDTEEWGHFYLGCAGGMDVQVRHACAQEVLAPGRTLVRLEVAGLRGGHSGIDIHLGRGNAIKLLAEALRELSEIIDLRLIEMAGGTARNAIPREAFAVAAVPAASVAQLETWVRQKHAEWRKRFAQADADVSLSSHLVSHEFAESWTDEDVYSPAASERRESYRAISNGERDRLLAFLDSVGNGVSLMSETFPNVVDTSSNLGIIALEENEFSATFKVRSLQDGRSRALAGRLAAQAVAHGLLAWEEGGYPGWTPNPASNLLARCQQVYAEQFGQPASLQVIHAGLECGLLAASHPQLDMISFGPDIRGAHAPGERVDIASVGRCWQLLKAVLRALATG